MPTMGQQTGGVRKGDGDDARLVAPRGGRASAGPPKFGHRIFWSPIESLIARGFIRTRSELWHSFRKSRGLRKPSTPANGMCSARADGTESPEAASIALF